MNIRHGLRYSRSRLLCALAGIAGMIVCSSTANAGFANDSTEFAFAISILRSAIGEHPRVLRIEADADGVAIEVQDPRNRNHVDQWRYGKVTYFQVVPVKRLSGPQAVDPQLVNPDLEGNLFDLDAIAFAAVPKLMTAAIARAQLQDAAIVTHVELARQVFILPKPASGDIRWTLRVDSGREHAEVYANAQGNIVGRRPQRHAAGKDPEFVQRAAIGRGGSGSLSRGRGPAGGCDQRRYSHQVHKLCH